MADQQVGILDEIRDLFEDSNAHITTTLPIWVLSAHAHRLSESWCSEQFHHQVMTAGGLTYARSSVRDGNLEVHELGNANTAARIEAAIAGLTGSGKRLLVVPSRQIIAVWQPADQICLVVFPERLSSATPITAESFDALLADIPDEVVDGKTY